MAGDHFRTSELAFQEAMEPTKCVVFGGGDHLWGYGDGNQEPTINYLGLLKNNIY